MEVALEAGEADDVVGATGVIHMEGGPTTVGGDQIVEQIVRALGPRSQPPAQRRPRFGLSHEHAILMAVTDGDVEKLIVATRAHEDAQAVRGQNGIADDIVVECQIKRNAGTGIVVQIKLGEEAFLRLIASQAVEQIGRASCREV